METNPTPSLIKIIQTDYYTFLSFIFLLILWSVFATFQILNFEIPPGAIYAALTLSVFALAVIIWRYQIIQALFSNRTEVLATITDLWFFRGRGRIDYIYSFRGHEYISGDDVVPTSKTRSFRTGDRVTVILDPDNPERAIINDLYDDF